MPSVSAHPDECIWDSGCTYHMCPIREWFFEFQEVDGGVVYMGNVLEIDQLVRSATTEPWKYVPNQSAEKQ